MSNSNFTVIGMTCNSCAMTVTEEVKEVPGVQDVTVELSTGTLTVASESDIDPALLQQTLSAGDSLCR